MTVSVQYSSEEEEEDLNVTAAGIASKQKKELAKVDHTALVYQPFRKSFYVEVPEIARMTPEEVEVYKEVRYIRLNSRLFRQKQLAVRRTLVIATRYVWV